MGNSLADKLAGEVADRVQVCLKVAEDCAEYYVTTQLIHSLEEMTCRLLLLYIYIYMPSRKIDKQIYEMWRICWISIYPYTPIPIYPWISLFIHINNCELNDGWGPHENSPEKPNMDNHCFHISSREPIANREACMSSPIGKPACHMYYKRRKRLNQIMSVI